MICIIVLPYPTSLPAVDKVLQRVFDPGTIRKAKLRGQFEQGNENKGPMNYPGMGYNQFRLAYALLAKKQQVAINPPWSPVNIAFAAQQLFNAQQVTHERGRCPGWMTQDLQDLIGKPGLVFDPLWFSVVYL